VDPLVVITAHHEIDTVFPDEIDETVLLGDASGPDATPQVLQWFGFANPAKRLTNDGFNEVQDSRSRFAVNIYPVPQVLAKLILEYREGRRSFTRAQIRTSAHPATQVVPLPTGLC
jgi:hypothetical protein